VLCPTNADDDVVDALPNGPEMLLPSVNPVSCALGLMGATTCRSAAECLTLERQSNACEQRSVSVSD
jgi:hypothetical protein